MNGTKSTLTNIEYITVVIRVSNLTFFNAVGLTLRFMFIISSTYLREVPTVVLSELTGMFFRTHYF